MKGTIGLRVDHLWVTRFLSFIFGDKEFNCWEDMCCEFLKRRFQRNGLSFIYAQLNPSYAKYYTKREAEKLLIDGKFKNVRTHHRHGYSWIIIGAKPYA